MTDDLIKRLRKADEYEPLGHDGWEAADRIEELVKERDENDALAAKYMNLAEVLETKLAKAVEALQYADKMVRLVLIYMTDRDNKDFSQAVFDTEKQITTTLAELEKTK